MSKKVCVITGCSDGIGKETAVQMASRGYRIGMVVRNSDKSRAAQKEIVERAKNDAIELFYADLASQTSVRDVARQLCEAFPAIDILINNAGIVKRSEEISDDGIEMTFAVNYIAPVLLTLLLLPTLEKSEAARIINLSSELYQKGKIDMENFLTPQKFNGDMAYANSKLLLIHFTVVLAKKLSSKQISVNAIHPGVLGTNAFREYPRWFTAVLNLFLPKPAEGATRVLKLATASEFENVNGAYISKTKIQNKLKRVFDPAQTIPIWENTLKILEIPDIADDFSEDSETSTR
ncbi:MAG: SDR family NAD(P)-dependent oxidoreductase [Deltaproteobacteria bacterium]|nr:SDR family NAD(P)-dependent oxidoreductase [Deltaproteobacteria bacterium]MBN2674714.1 SDR family NAD(P)-dependent oxidoreductase [Deltaproteobacteria bacterium]